MKSRFLLSILHLMCAAIAGSTTATFFDSISGASGSLKACWRLQSTSLVQIPFAICEFNSNRNKSKNFLRRNWWLILISSLVLAAHFALLATSLEHTSIAHSITFVCANPIIAIIVQLFTKNKPNLLQILGVLIGFGGLITLTLTISSDEDASAFGDILALFSGVAMVAYLHCGKYARKLDVMWIYMCPVNLFASFFSYFLAISIQKDSSGRIVEWFYTFNGVYVLCLGIIPGNIAHASFNYLLKILSPVVITAFNNFQPMFASLVGWLAGYQKTPTIWTCVGGCFLIIGNTIITFGEKKSVSAQENNTENEEISIKLASDY